MTDLATDLARLATADDLPLRGFLPLGSFGVNVAAGRPEYAATLDLLFRQRVTASPRRPDDAIAARLQLRPCAADDPLFTLGRPVEDGAPAAWQALDGGWSTLGTGRFRVFLRATRHPADVVCLVREPQWSERAFRDHLFEIVCKVLFAFDRFYVHAAAVELHGRVHVFVGRGSFGKSTTCLTLARAGATILSEDHVLFARDGDGFVVSGCQETARVTEKTERFLFPAPLDAAPEAHTGVLKKEFRVADHFACRPYVDHGFESIFFNHVGTTFRIREMPRQEAMLGLFYMTKSFFRASRPADYDRYLDYFAALVQGRSCYELELSPDLGDLAQLVRFLGA